MKFVAAATAIAFALISAAASAADYPAPKQGDWIAKDFRFHTGETMPELRLHYTTIGEPTGQPVLVHGSGQSGAAMLTPTFAGELFGAGPAARCDKVFHHHPRQHRPRPIVKAVGRHEDGVDANDFIYQWEASHDYDPSAGLEKIAAATLLINAADDERNPPETGVTEAALKRIKNAKLHLITASPQTRGHSTTGNASFYAQPLRELLQTAPQRTM